VLPQAAPADDVVLVVCPELSDGALNELFGASWPDHEQRSFRPVLEHSLAWIGAFRPGRSGSDGLVGFVNVAGDGGVHAFVLDPTVHPDERRRGLGLRLVGAAADAARSRGATWLHVDFESDLADFYARCGFQPTAAGLMRL
jgi:GNAT superfamily N-acetyltransferase